MLYGRYDESTEQYKERLRDYIGVQSGPRLSELDELFHRHGLIALADSPYERPQWIGRKGTAYAVWQRYVTHYTAQTLKAFCANYANLDASSLNSNGPGPIPVRLEADLKAHFEQ